MKKILLLVTSLIVKAGMAQANDLMTAYRDAVAYDAEFAAAKASLAAGREKEAQGLSGLLPAIALTAGTNWNEEDSTRRGGGRAVSVDYNSHRWVVQLTQPLFRWQNIVQYRQGELGSAQAQAQFNLARQDLIVRVCQAYFDLLLAQEAVTTAIAQRTAIGEQLELAKRSFEVGTATITDTHEAQARFDLATAQEIASQNDLLIKKQVLRKIIGKEYESPKPLREGVRLSPPQPNDLGKWVESAELSGLGVQVSQLGLEIASKEVDKQRAGHYPTIDITASRGLDAATNQAATLGFGYDTYKTTVGLQLSLPILGDGKSSGWGYVASRDREAVALRDKAQADLDKARREAALAARQAYLGVTAGLAQINAFEAAVVSSRLAVESNKIGYDVGVRINIDVLNAQTQLYDTRQKLAKARFDTLISQLKLKNAAGTLSDEDVAAINALLE